jgi:hypothetical protein
LGANINIVKKDNSKMEMKTIKDISKFMVKRLHQNAVMPKKGSPGAAGYDICASE